MIKLDTKTLILKQLEIEIARKQQLLN